MGQIFLYENHPVVGLLNQYLLL